MSGMLGSIYRRLVRGSSGTVTIYLAAVMAGMIFLTGTLIDFGRIAAFRNQAELAVKAGSRAVLSAYDPLLYQRYGLFGTGGSTSEALLSEVLAGHTETEDADALRLLDTEWSEAEVLESRPLAAHGIFRRQVLEEMKYKAPIDLTIDLASRFRGLPALMKEARKTSDLLEDMRTAYEKREKALDRALRRQKEAGDSFAGSLRGLVPQPPTSLTGSKQAGDVRDTADAALMYGDYAAKRAEDAARAEARRLREAESAQHSPAPTASPRPRPSPTPEPDDGPRYGAQIAAYEQGVQRLSGQLSAKASQASAAMEEALAAALRDIEEAGSANREMARIAETAETAAQTPAEWPAETGAGGFDGGEAGSLRELRRTTADMVLTDAYWTRYRDELAGLRESGGELKAAATSFAGTLGAAPGSSGMDGALRQGAERLQSLLSVFSGRYGASGSVTAGRIDALRSQRAGDEERKALEERSRSAWSGAAAFLGTLSGLRSSPEERQAFDRVRGLYERNLSWNKVQVEAAASARLPVDASEGRKAAFSSADGWMDALGDGVGGLRDAVYFAEYSYARFTMAEPSAVRSMLNGGGAGLLMPHAQENEYILYGLGNPAANISAAYGEIFSLRLAVRTMEGLIECRSYGHPLVVLAAAALYGISEAVKDIQGLLDKGVIPLSKYAKIDTYYKDYIRLFLLLHGGSDAQTARRIALIEDGLDVDLQEAYTYASVRGVSSIRLWFLPGAARLAGKTASWKGTVKGSRYEATYAANYGYQ
ncbi:TadE/TadG family type IV pilus assembly protein [Cohnella sp. JJ-181]|uniref:TadE/TadG family type IV pilus assembly protein n=1 Tax=Cohnella rhizoplanae TaxID=2974897 RepID=UPI00233030D9|nr:hypothetical protein [Cohnella sp. JJ-181]